MVRLTVVSQTHQETVLKVEGWISGGNVGILEQEGERLFGETQCLVLDLDGVQFIDREGMGLLKRWRGDRLRLRGGSIFVCTLLEQHGLV